MKIWLLLVSLLLISEIGYTQSDAYSNRTSLLEQSEGTDDLTRAYRILSKKGNYEDKKAVLGVFQEDPANERVVAMCVDLLIYNYTAENFKENDQVMYYDDVIAEELIRILGKGRSKTAAPALLKVALQNKLHRELTILEAWKSLQNIEW